LNRFPGIDAQIWDQIQWGSYRTERPGRSERCAPFTAESHGLFPHLHLRFGQLSQGRLLRCIAVPRQAAAGKLKPEPGRPRPGVRERAAAGSARRGPTRGSRAH
jgi:hypothetical protein